MCIRDRPIEGQISRSELLEIKNTMNTRALAKRRGRTALRLTANVLFAFVVLLPLLYAVSIAFMPSSELFTTELNILPKHPTWSNFINAFTVSYTHLLSGWHPDLRGFLCDAAPVLKMPPWQYRYSSCLLYTSRCV